MPAPQARRDRRKARTRAALVAAAQQLLADGRAEVSIQEITDTADVGFGSFFNHFPGGKDELWAAAVRDAMRRHAELVASLTETTEDPAEVFCVGLRLTGRLQRAFPTLARVLLRSGLEQLTDDRGLMAYVRRDVQAAIDAGRFDRQDVDLALSLAGGSLLGLIALLDARPDLDAASVADSYAVRVLRALGVVEHDAQELVRRPLPALPGS